MPKRCTICAHADRRGIEDALAGEPSLRTIAGRWSVSKTSLLRHREKHLPQDPPPPEDVRHEAHPPPPPVGQCPPRPRHTITTGAELHTTLTQYRTVTARLAMLERIPEERWFIYMTAPREVVLGGLRDWQRTLRDRLQGWVE